MMRKQIFILVILVTFILSCRFLPSGARDLDLPIDGVVPLPPNQDYGVLCFVEFQDAIVANAPVFQVYNSQDGGLSWHDDGIDYTGLSGSICSPNSPVPKALWASPDGLMRYRFDQGVSIHMSVDSGESWQQVYDLTSIPWEPAYTPEPDREVVVQTGPLDAMIDPKSGNLLLAMGHAGVLLHLPSGEWQWVGVGAYVHDFEVTAPTVGETEVDGRWDLLPTPGPPDGSFGTQTHYVNALVFSPDSNTLATSGFDGGIKLHAFPDGDLLHWQQWGQDVQHRKLYGATFSPDGLTLVTCGTNVDRMLRFWYTEGWELIDKMDGFQTSVMDTGSFNGEQFLAIAYTDETSAISQVKIFHLPDGREWATYDSQVGIVSSLRFIPERWYLAMGGTSGGVQIWDLAAGEVILTLQPDRQMDDIPDVHRKVYALGYDSAQAIMLSMSGDGRLNAWYLPGGERAWELALPIPHGWYTSSAVFSPDGRLVAVGMHNGTLRVFDSRDGHIFYQRWASSGTLMKLAFSPDSHWLAAGFSNGQIEFWDVDRLLP